MEEQRANPVGIQSMEHLGEYGMSEEQRQEEFKKAYMAELERYNDENKDGELVEVQVDKQGWDAEMNGDAMDDEELDDIEWEWCHADESAVNDIEVSVNGHAKSLKVLDDDDLQNMTPAEFMVRIVNVVAIAVQDSLNLTFCIIRITGMLPHVHSRRVTLLR